MGHRYYATVTFPKAALAIPEVEAAWKHFDEKQPGCKKYDIDTWDDGTQLTVADGEANYGEIAIWKPDGSHDGHLADILAQARVPHDWHHSESEGGNESFTTHVRYGEDGEQRDYETTEASDARLELADRVLELLKLDRLDIIERELRAIVATCPGALSDLNWLPDNNKNKNEDHPAHQPACHPQQLEDGGA